MPEEITPHTQSSHVFYMQEALQFAENGRFTCDPNPMVGAIIVKDGTIIGRGFHRKAGEAHAEVNAIQNALQQGHSLKNADLYVTLEPCNHHGRTPPCCEAIEKHLFNQIFIACQDPNPLVGGQGIKRLQKKYNVQVGLLEAEALELNHAFFHRMRTQRPWVQLKMAASIDGRTALHNDKSQWITGPAARKDVHRLRLAASAIITGRGTLIKDNARLNAREDMLGFIPERQPTRIILDQQLLTIDTLEKQAPFQKTLLVTTPQQFKTAVQKTAHLNNLECVASLQTQNLIDIDHLLKMLSDKCINSLLIEAGPTLAGQFLEQKLVDEIILYLAPIFLGQDAKAMFQLPLINNLPTPGEWNFHSIGLIDDQSQQDLKVVLRHTQTSTLAQQGA